MKRILFAALLAVLCGIIYTNTRQIPDQVLDTPEPLHLKQDEVEYPVDQKDYGQEIEKAYRSSIAPAGWDKSEVTVLEEIDQPVVLSVSSSSSASKASRPPFIPHHKVWHELSTKPQNLNARTSSQEPLSAPSPESESQSAFSKSSSSKPLFCFLTGTGSRAQKRLDYCNSLR